MKLKKLLKNLLLITTIILASCVEDGLDGVNGTNGTNGVDGNNIVTNISTELAGTNCTNGGIKIQLGLDTNSNNTLDDSEITNTDYICNGSNGTNGYNVLIATETENEGTNCTNGGLKINIGLDINNDEILEASEITVIDYICNGQTVSEYFSTLAKISLGDGVPEISAFDSKTKTIFSTNSEAREVDVIDISNLSSPQIKSAIDITAYGGNVNSVACKNGYLAIAVEAEEATNNGKIVTFKTDDLSTPYTQITAGALPDMVTFTPDGKYIIAANEGEPNKDYTIDPKGSITLIDVETQATTQIYFDNFNSQEAALEANGFRVFGPGADLSTDVEPEYITVSSDSKTAFIALQENNGIAKLDIDSKTITDIYPLGTKNYSEIFFDLSDKDDMAGKLSYWPVLSFYQPDAIDYFEINGTGYIISANEGDARDYDGYSEEERVEDLTLDPTSYPEAATLQETVNLGRLKVTTANGDIDNDGDIDQIYGYGARSFSIWSTNGVQLFDSGNEFTLKGLFDFGNYPENRSDDKGTEPEAVTTFTENNNTYAIIGLERSGDVLIYNISDIYNPVFVQRLRNTSPEGLVIVDAANSPNGKTLLIVSNESSDDGTLNIYTK
ncbi:choice-of-anchor I family protein [uncultured Polaribacter sp.]|uniref:choice-of-anchor I family protein n=1 Tax=uncultured Polaribacter sp. TaxID=174711 RepID=UPI00260F7DCA|nr:choice-of-anchor I family protein [uncultured Polaribacter sp.]